MKKNVHPTLVDTTVKCACGNEFVVKSYKPELPLETCNKCHPFYTGEKSKVSQTGRIEKFNQKFNLN